MEKHVVLPDLHGQAELYKRAINHYGDDAHFVVIGDAIHRGPSSRGVLQIIGDTNSTLLLGNHELMLLGALTDKDTGSRENWQKAWLDFPKVAWMSRRILAEYGIEPYRRNEDTASAMREAMHDAGHLALLQNASVYFETDDMLVIHAGLENWRPWKVQQHAIDRYHEAIRAQNIGEVHPSLDSFSYATDWKRPYDAGILVTGHHHSRLPQENRTYRQSSHMPTRVQLASDLMAGDPMFVYESWTKTIRSFEL